MTALVTLITIIALCLIAKPYIDSWVLNKSMKIKTASSKKQLLEYHNNTK